LPTLGLHYLATALEQHGHDAHVVEGYGLSHGDMLRRLQAYRPDVLGISLQTPLWPSAKQLITQAKAVLPDLRIAIGGAHVNLKRSQLFEEAPEVDAAFGGPAEGSFQNWVQNLNGKCDPVMVDAPNGERRLAEETGFAQRVTARVPWETYIPNLMFLGHQRFATSVSTMGCASACSFCGLTKNMRGRWARPADSIVEELTYLSKKRGIRTVNFMDDNTLFAHPGDEADELLERLIKADLDIEWTIYLNNFTIEADRLRRMKRAGCRRTLILTESGSQRIANLAHGREVPLDTIANMVERVHSAGIEASARFQIGFPTETWSDGMESVRFGLKLPLALASYVKTLILPGSRVGRKALNAGKAAIADERWSYYGRPVPPDSMSAEEQTALVKKGIRSFYGKQLLKGDLFRLPRPFHIMRRVLLDGTE